MIQKIRSFFRGTQKNLGTFNPFFFNRLSYSRTQIDNFYKFSEEGYAYNSAVFKAVSVIASNAASVPIKVMRNDKEVIDHPLKKILKRPNMDQSGFEFMNTLVSHLLLGGNAYIVNVAEMSGQVRRMKLLRPDLVNINVEGSKITYVYTPEQGKEMTFTSRKLKHVKLFNPLSDTLGLSPLSSCSMDVDMMNQVTEYNLDTLLNGGMPKHFMSWALKDQAGKSFYPNADVVEEKRQEIQDKLSGARNTNRVHVLAGEFTPIDLTKSSRESEYMKAKEMAMRDIGNAFKLPPQILGVSGSQTFANYHQAVLSMWEEAIIPVCEKVRSDLEEFLVMAYDDEGLSIVFDYDKMPAMKEKYRMEAETAIKLVDAGIITLNEARMKLKEYADVKGGDVLRVATGKHPIDMDLPMELPDNDG